MRKSVLIVAFVLGSMLWGFSFQGYLSSSLYSFNREDREQTSLQHVRLYESFMLQAKDLGFKNSRLNLAGIFYTDPANAFGSDPVLRLYKASYETGIFSTGIHLNLGRQFVYSLATTGRMDGAQLKYSWHNLHFKGFGGGYVPASGWTSDPAGDFLAGAELKWNLRTDLKLGLGIASKNHAREVYRSTITSKDIEVPATVEERVAYQLEYNPGSTQLYFRGRHRISDWSLTEFTAIATRDLSGFRNLRIEYNFREPRVPENSIFSVFDASNTQDIRVSGSHRLRGSLNGNFQIRHIIFDGDVSDVATLGIGTQSYQINYVYQSGYGGATSRLQLSGQRDFGRYNLYGRYIIGRYKLLEGTWDDLATYVAGTRLSFRKRFTLNAEVQGLSNQFYNRDIRFLCTLIVRI